MEFSNSLMQGIKNSQVPFSEGASSSAFHPVRRFVLLSYNVLNVETVDTELSGVTSAHLASILAFLAMAYIDHNFLS